MTNNAWFTIDPSLSPYYSGNLTLFRKQDSEQAALIESRLSELVHLEFFKLGEDQYACRMEGVESSFYEANSFSEHLNREFVRILNVYKQGMELVVISGSGLGYLAAHAEEDIREKMNCGLLLLETRPELIAAQFCLFDCRALLQSPQVFWAIGEPQIEKIRKVFERFRFDLISPARIFPVQERWLSPSERAQLPQTGQWITRTCKESDRKRQIISGHYIEAMKRPAQLYGGRLWGSATPDAYVHTPLMRSLVQGFSDSGWQTRLFEINTRFANFYPIRESMQEFIPDVILVCNAANKSFLSDEFQRPRIVWILDHPRYFAGDTLIQYLSELDYVFYADRFYGEELKNTRAKECRFLPVTPSVLRQGERRGELAAPILFVGTYKDASPFYQSLPPTAAEEIFHLLDELILHPTETGSDVMQRISISEQTLDILQRKAFEFTARIHYRLPDAQRQTDYFLYSLANSRKREQAVRALLDRGIVVYGPDSWLKVLGNKYASQYRGWLKHDDLPDVYASADVVLNLHSMQCPTCLNCRDFDVLASGGCLLTDWVEDMDRGLVEPGRDCVVIRQIGDLDEIIRELLEQENRRKEIREKGHATYLKRHTPRHRAAEIIEILQKTDPSQGKRIGGI